MSLAPQGRRDPHERHRVRGIVASIACAATTTHAARRCKTAEVVRI
jgi:hypothetical protein